jgi:hypothetical protein
MALSAQCATSGTNPGSESVHCEHCEKLHKQQPVIAQTGETECGGEAATSSDRRPGLHEGSPIFHDRHGGRGIVHGEGGNQADLLPAMYEKETWLVRANHTRDTPSSVGPEAPPS